MTLLHYNKVPAGKARKLLTDGYNDVARRSEFVVDRYDDEQIRVYNMSLLVLYEVWLYMVRQGHTVALRNFNMNDFKNDPYCTHKFHDYTATDFYKVIMYVEELLSNDSQLRVPNYVRHDGIRAYSEGLGQGPLTIHVFYRDQPFAAWNECEIDDALRNPCLSYIARSVVSRIFFSGTVRPIAKSAGSICDWQFKAYSQRIG